MGQLPVQQYQIINQRETGERCTKEGGSPDPGNWLDFLRDHTRQDCRPRFPIREDCIHYLPRRKAGLRNFWSLCSLKYTDHSMPQCDHEEADTRILIHLQQGSATSSPRARSGPTASPSGPRPLCQKINHS